MGLIGVMVDYINEINAIEFDVFKTELKQKCYVKTYNTIKIRSVKLSVIKPHFRPLKIPAVRGY